MGNTQFAEIIREVRANGVVTVEMGVFKEAMGVGRLGRIVRQKIKRGLKSKGIGFMPDLEKYPFDELPHNYRESVRLYDPDHDAGELMIRVFELSEKADEWIRGKAEGSSHSIQKAQTHSAQLLDALDLVTDNLAVLEDRATKVDSALTNSS